MEINHSYFMNLAYQQALEGYQEGGLPIGAVMVSSETGKIIAKGRNRREQDGDPIAHGEMDCIRKAGRRNRYNDIILYTTLSPCMMCTGTIIQFGIPKVVVGENINFKGNIDFLSSNGVEVILLDDKECKELMSKFIKEKPELWDEDIAGNNN